MFLSEEKHPANRTAVITDNDISFTYGDIYAFNDLIAKLISDRCLVFCLCKNSIGSLFGYTSFISNSLVPVMLYSAIDSELLRTLINKYRPQYVWLPDDRTNEFEGEIVLSHYDYSLIKLEERNLYDLHPELALLLTTSGSTGSSKYVRITYENLRSNTESICSYLSFNQHERAITTLPMWYAYGLSVINCSLKKGATLLLTSKTIVEKEFWGFLKDQKASSFSGVPYTFEILKDLKFARISLPSLKTITQAGGKLSDELNTYISEYAANSGKHFFVMYGQTEATARMSYLLPEYNSKKKGSIGRGLPGSILSLTDEKGNEITEPHRTGELVYKGKNVSMGYAYSGNDLVKGDENKGILFTGDLAKKDEEGFYYITGRKNRSIKLFGNRVDLDEMEALVLKQIPECACTGSDDNLCIHITDETKLTEIKNYIVAKTGIRSNVISVKHRGEIPKTVVGKINYTLLQQA